MDVACDSDWWRCLVDRVMGLGFGTKREVSLLGEEVLGT